MMPLPPARWRMLLRASLPFWLVVLLIVVALALVFLVSGWFR